MPILFKTLEFKDFVPALIFEQQFFKSTATMYNYMLSHIICKGLSHICLEGNRIIGIIRAEFDPESSQAMITALCVKPELRKQGIGSALLQKTLEKIQKIDNIKKTLLHVSTRNVEAIKLYQKYSFKIVEKIPNFYSVSDDAYLMALKN